MITFLITRHGQTEANAAGRWQGHHDSPLTSEGIRQAEALGKRLARFHPHITTLYSSDLGRALHTAQLIAAATGHEIQPEPRLREIQLGIFQGLTREEIQARYPEHWDAMHHEGPAYAIPDGESGFQHRDRVIGCLEELAARHPEETLLIVAHGGTLNLILKHTFGLVLDRRRRFAIPNTCLNRFVWINGEWHLITWGDTAHLENSPHRG